MASAPLAITLPLRGDDAPLSHSFNRPALSTSPPRGILKSSCLSDPPIDACRTGSPPWMKPDRRRSKSVNFWLETPYQTLSKVRSHSLVQSQSSSDRMPPEPGMAELRAATVPQAVYNILFNMSSVLVVVLPGLLCRVGWWGLPVVLGVGGGMLHAAQCITRFVLDDPGLLTYRDVGAKAWGPWGSYAVLGLQVVNYGAAALAALMLGVDHLILVLHRHAPPNAPPIPYPQAVCLTAFLAVPLFFFRNLDNIGYMSLVGCLVSLTSAACMAGALLLHLLQHKLEVAAYHPSGHLQGVLCAATVLCFAFGDHMNLVFPGLLGVMRQPQEYKRALAIAFACKAAAFTLLPVVFFYVFGCGTESNALRNLPPGILTSMALLMMTALCLFMVAVVLNPLFYLTELLLGVEQQGPHRPTFPEVVSRCVVRSIMGALLAATAVQLNHSGVQLLDLLRFVGGGSALLSAWVLPLSLFLTSYYDVIEWPELGRCALLLSVACTLFGLNLRYTVLPVTLQVARGIWCLPTPALAPPTVPNPSRLHPPPKPKLDPPRTPSLTLPSDLQWGAGLM